MTPEQKAKACVDFSRDEFETALKRLHPPAASHITHYLPGAAKEIVIWLWMYPTSEKMIEQAMLRAYMKRCFDPGFVLFKEDCR